jgi:hypothetical protein
LSQGSNLGLPELVAFTEDQSVEIATGLADIPRLKELRETLRPRMEKSVLMDGPHFARQIEACYRSMWREWCAKQAPRGQIAALQWAFSAASLQLRRKRGLALAR